MSCTPLNITSPASVCMEDHSHAEPLQAGAPALPVPGYPLPVPPQVQPPAPLRLAPPPSGPVATPPPGTFALGGLVLRTGVVGVAALLTHVGWGLYESQQPLDTQSELLMAMQDLLPQDQREIFAERFSHDKEFSFVVIDAYESLQEAELYDEEAWLQFEDLGLWTMAKNVELSDFELQRLQQDWSQYLARQRKLLAENYCASNPSLDLASCYVTYGLSSTGQSLKVTSYSLTVMDPNAAFALDRPSSPGGPGSGPDDLHVMRSRDKKFHHLAKAAGVEAPHLNYEAWTDASGSLIIDTNLDDVERDMQQMARAVRVVGPQIYPEHQVGVEVVIKFDAMDLAIHQGDPRAIERLAETFLKPLYSLNWSDPTFWGARLVFELPDGTFYNHWLKAKPGFTRQGPFAKTKPVATSVAFEDVAQPIVTVTGLKGWGHGVHLGDKLMADGSIKSVVYEPTKGKFMLVETEDVQPVDPTQKLLQFVDALATYHRLSYEVLRRNADSVSIKKMSDFGALGEEIGTLKVEARVLPPVQTLAKMMQISKSMQTLFRMMSAEGGFSSEDEDVFDVILGLRNWQDTLRAIYPMTLEDEGLQPWRNNPFYSPLKSVRF